MFDEISPAVQKRAKSIKISPQLALTASYFVCDIKVRSSLSYCNGEKCLEALWMIPISDECKLRMQSFRNIAAYE